MKIVSFDEINLQFQNIYYNDDQRSRRVSRLIFNLLDEKLNTSSFENMVITKSANKITLDKVEVPHISVDHAMSDYEIAYRCSSAIYQAILDKLY